MFETKPLARNLESSLGERNEIAPFVGGAEVLVQRGGLAEIKVLYPNGSDALHAELYARRADRASDPWRAGVLENGPIRFTPLTVLGASNGWARDEVARPMRCQLINADLEAAWAVRIKVRES